MLGGRRDARALPSFSSMASPSPRVPSVEPSSDAVMVLHVSG
jgi:hypothetical protein